MYEYFGVGPQVREDVDGIYPRFLCWLPKYRLSTPSKCSLEVWLMVIDNLTVADVIFFFFFWCGIFVFKGFCGLVFFLLWVLCDFQMSLNPWLGCEEYVRNMPQYLSFLLRSSCISSCMILSHISAL